MLLAVCPPNRYSGDQIAGLWFDLERTVLIRPRMHQQNPPPCTLTIPAEHQTTPLPMPTLVRGDATRSSLHNAADVPSIPAASTANRRRCSLAWSLLGIPADFLSPLMFCGPVRALATNPSYALGRGEAAASRRNDGEDPGVTSTQHSPPQGLLRSLVPLPRLASFAASACRCWLV
jgi:hypothetical protein